MPLNNITFVLGQGGLGRPAPGQDYISGMIFYTANLPAGLSSTNRTKLLLSTADAEALGISDNYSDATPATVEQMVTGIGANGDTADIQVVEAGGVVYDLGTYKKGAGETTATLVAAAIVAIINGGTINHGYTAANAAGVITITAPKRNGIFLNAGTPLTITIVGTLAITVSQVFTGGVASEQAVWHYHINRFFTINPTGQLYLGMYAIPGTYNYNEVTVLQSFAGGKIRQIGVYKKATALAANGADLVALDTVCKANVTLHKELIAILGADISGTADLTTLFDNSGLSANTAMIDISQDGGALGATLYLTTGKSITNLGALLGAASLAKVSESIAWPQKFNMSDGVEDDVIAFANGQLYSTVTAVNENTLTLLQNMRYTFLRKFQGFEGSYFNDDRTAVAETSDYSHLNNNRSIQKATRGVYAALVPFLSSPIVLNSVGTLSDATIAAIQVAAEKPLIQMQRDGELSAQVVVIDPTQNVASTSLLIVAISLVPIGTSRNIQVNIGFNVSIN